MNHDQWFVSQRPNPDAGMRLFCLPFAGGGASVYRSWPAAFTDHIEIRALQLPGRETRFTEPRISEMTVLARALAEAMTPYLDRPYAMFGYSIGSLVAFEVIRELRRRQQALPVHLFAAASRAPHTPMTHPPLGKVSSEEFIDQVNHYFQPSDEAWNMPELRDLILPVLRDDILIADNYSYTDEPSLPCPIDVYVGSDDRGTPLESAQAWKTQTAAEFNMSVFPGHHFFMNDSMPDVQKKVYERLKSHINGAA